MLVLTRKAGEELIIGDNIRVIVNRIAGNRVAIGLVAPEEVRIVRGELHDTVTAFEEGTAEGEATEPIAPSLELDSPLEAPRQAR